MKKTQLILMTMSLLCAFNCSFSQVITTRHFQNLTTSDGLVSDDINDILILNDSNLWIATSSGLSHYDGNIFTNYSAANSSILSHNLRELAFAQNKIWMVTDSGLTSFDGSTFTNYTARNGLLNASIEGIAVTSTDTLWITGLSGTSKFDGSTFTHYRSQVGRDIEVDDMDRVYAMRFSLANNFPFAHLYENGVWSLPAPTGISFGVLAAKLIKTSENNLFVVGSGNKYFKLTYPLNLELKTVYLDSGSVSPAYGGINLLQLEEGNGLTFVGGGKNVPFYNVGSDSNFVRQFVEAADALSSVIKRRGNILAIGSDKGLFLSKPTLKSSVNKLPFSVNQISTSVSITDPLFSDFSNAAPNFEFPKNSNRHGISSANFIVAGKKRNQSQFIVYPDNGFSQAFYPGPIHHSGGLAGEYMFRITEAEIVAHQNLYNQPGYVMPKSIREWPTVGDTVLGVAIDLAPFADVNNNGCYDPDLGDYPIIKGDEAIYWINHPIDESLELEYHWMMYGFSSSGNGSGAINASLNQSIFLQYTIVNRSAEIYDSLKVGLTVDGDIGDPTDDFVGVDSIFNIMYFYNGDSFDGSFFGTNGYGNRAPALGVKFLSDPMDNALNFNNGFGFNGNPTVRQDWLNYLNSRWRNGQAVTFGGDGFNNSVSGKLTRHMYTGKPSTQLGWSEVTPLLPSGLSNAPGDRRMVGSIPYFSLQPQERKTIEVVIGYGQTDDSSNVIGKNVQEMVSILNGAERIWNLLTVPTTTFASHDSCLLITSIQEIDQSSPSTISIYPVPAQNSINVESVVLFEKIEIYDMKGSLVLHLNPVQSNFNVDVSQFNEGIYFMNAYTGGEVESEKFVVLR